MTLEGEMTRPPYRVEALTMKEWPTNLYDAATAAKQLGISEERLVGLANGGFAPHYRIDGGNPLFKISELKQWAAINLLEKVDGREMPEPVRVVCEAPRVLDYMHIPQSMREIQGLREITSEILRTGIYFLCRDGALLYVGQSVNAASRVAEHYKRYNFDAVYFLPWPADDLNRIEAALIRALRPPVNGQGAAGTKRTSWRGTEDEDTQIMAMLQRVGAEPIPEIASP